MNDPLDELLKKSPLKEAPPWFEVKLMARLRREKDQEKSFNPFAFFQRRLVLSGVCALLIALFTVFYFFNNQPESPEQHKKILAALDAFEDYEEDQILWETDLL